MECLGICICGLLGYLMIYKKNETCVVNINGCEIHVISGMAWMEREKSGHFIGAKRIEKMFQEGVEKGGGTNTPPKGWLLSSQKNAAYLQVPPSETPLRGGAPPSSPGPPNRGLGLS